MKRSQLNLRDPGLACGGPLDDEDDGLDEEVDAEDEPDLEEGDVVGSTRTDDEPGDATWDHLDGDDECLPGDAMTLPSVLEAIAAEAYAEAKLDPNRPNIVQLARRLGWKRHEHPHTAPTGRERTPLYPSTVLVPVFGNAPFYIRHCFPPQEPTFGLAHALGHWLLQRHGYGVMGEDIERDADYIAAALLAPKPAFLAAYRDLGPDLPALASRFRMKEVGVALRMGEVLELPIAVVSTPDRLRRRVRLRGPDHWRWPDEATLLAWAENPRKGVRRVKIGETAVMLDASGLEHAQEVR